MWAGRGTIGAMALEEVAHEGGGESDDEPGVSTIVGTSFDITERKESREALRESERGFRMPVEGVTDHAIYMLDPSGVVSNWNPGAERLKGYTADDRPQIAAYRPAGKRTS